MDKLMAALLGSKSEKTRVKLKEFQWAMMRAALSGLNLVGKLGSKKAFPRGCWWAGLSEEYLVDDLVLQLAVKWVLRLADQLATRKAEY